MAQSHLYAGYVLDDVNKCPVIYSGEYNIGFFGLEKLHPFDSKKWLRIYDFLIEGGLNADAIFEPKEVEKEDLSLVHSERYLKSLNSRIKLTRILEVGLVLFFPTCCVNKRVLKPMRYQTGGTVLAARLALTSGWAINIGGGFHHASRDKGGGFCAYADLTLAIRVLIADGLIKRAMIVDVDAHQGNGHERDFATERQNIYILDFFNEQIYPHDREARMSISQPVPLRSGTADAEYILRLRDELAFAFEEFPSPDLLVYVAGTDSLAGDPLGLLQLSSEGIVQRDEIVFRVATQHRTPIVMVTSGGYTCQSARVVADSILNLHRKELVVLCVKKDPA